MAWSWPAISARIIYKTKIWQKFEHWAVRKFGHCNSIKIRKCSNRIKFSSAMTMKQLLLVQLANRTSQEQWSVPAAAAVTLTVTNNRAADVNYVPIIGPTKTFSFCSVTVKFVMIVSPMKCIDNGWYRTHYSVSSPLFDIAEESFRSMLFFI